MFRVFRCLLFLILVCASVRPVAAASLSHAWSAPWQWLTVLVGDRWDRVTAEELGTPPPPPRRPPRPGRVRDASFGDVKDLYRGGGNGSPDAPPPPPPPPPPRP